MISKKAWPMRLWQTALITTLLLSCSTSYSQSTEEPDSIAPVHVSQLRKANVEHFVLIGLEKVVAGQQAVIDTCQKENRDLTYVTESQRERLMAKDSVINEMDTLRKNDAIIANQELKKIKKQRNGFILTTLALLAIIIF